MKVNTNKMFKVAQKQNFAIPATNFIDLESARAYTEVAEDRNLPLILAYAESHKEIISLEEAAIIGNYFSEKIKTPVALHLDHGSDPEFIFKAIKLGFKSVMIDASEKSFKENIATTKKIVDFAHKYDVTVEAELGHVGANDYSESSEITDSVYTEVKDVVEFVTKTNIDSLAISIGTAHGVYKGIPKINFERLVEINEKTDIPLVLHGGSSTGDENLHRCAVNGINKINIYSDFVNGAYNTIQNSEVKDYIELKNLAIKSMKQTLNHYFDVFNTQSML